MNRIEVVGLFSALKKLCECGAHEKVEEVIDEVLKEAKTKSDEKGEK